MKFGPCEMLVNESKDPVQSERERLQALRRYEILDTPPDGSLDHITALAAALFKVPISILTLVDHDRIWFKSKYGLDVDEIGNEPGLCVSALLSDEPWIVEDARIDPRTLANPLVAGEFGLRFYLGYQLKTHDGFKLGTLCVVDREPRVVTPEEVKILGHLAAVAMDQIELRLAARQKFFQQERDRRELEAARREAVIANQAKSEFLAMVSHELRTPLNAILGFSEIIKDGVFGPVSPPRYAMYATDINRSAGRLLELINSMLDLSKVETGGITPNPESVDLQPVIAEAVGLFKRECETRAILMKRTRSIPARAFVDRSTLHQALLNVLSNAVRLSPSGATITIKVEVKEQTIEISVRDRGPGFPPDVLAELGMPFPGRTRAYLSKEGSSGLGLALTSALLRAQNGHISAGNRRGGGSIVRLVVPRTAQP